MVLATLGAWLASWDGCVAPAAESALTAIGLPHLPATMSGFIFLQSDLLCPIFRQYLHSPSNLVTAFLSSFLALDSLLGLAFAAFAAFALV